MLTIDDARALAKRWAWNNAALQFAILDDEADESPLDSDELAALLGWVRERMAHPVALVRRGIPGHEPNREELASVVACDLSLAHETAHALCEAAGWPS